MLALETWFGLEAEELEERLSLWALGTGGFQRTVKSKLSLLSLFTDFEFSTKIGYRLVNHSFCVKLTKS